MAWIEVHQSVVNHPKTVALAKELKRSPVYVVGHLVCFWLWCLEYAKDGDVSRFSAQVIAKAAQFGGNAEHFVNALKDVGFLDESQGKLEVHDWYDYAGRLIEKREQNMLRMRATRAKNVQRTSDARAGLPNRTVPTVPNHTKPTVRNGEQNTTVIDIHERYFGPIGVPSEKLQEAFMALQQYPIERVEELYQEARQRDPPIRFPAGWVLSRLEADKSAHKARDRPGKLPTGEELRESWGEAARRSSAEIERIVAQSETEQSGADSGSGT